MSLDHINEAELAQSATERLHERMLIEWPDENLEYQLNILSQFNDIAASSIKDQGQIAIPGGAQAIPLTEDMLNQAVMLFSEGVFQSLVKFREFSVPQEVQTHILQTKLAAYLLEQSQVMVATTFGQEHTPDFQLSPEHQANMMKQTAESALLHFINEHEKQYGPIHPQAITQEVTQKVEAVEQQEVYQEVPEAMPQPVATPTAAMPKGPSPHDKYAAVALLLGALSNPQRISLLRQFNAEEKELITFYSLARHIEQNLDLSYVEAHLKRFRDMLGQGASSLRSPASREIEAMAEELPADVLLSWIKHERPLVHTYLGQYLGDQSSARTPANSPEGTQPRHLSGNLPPRVEEVLAQYLKRQRAS